jgi:hypothetical protein
VYQHLDDYIGKLLLQKETEQYLNSACDGLMESIDAKDQSTFIHDVFEAEFMKTFKGPDGEKLFIDCADECHLAFSLCVDHFNTNGLHKQGPSTSSGIIAMACLNLSIQICYKPEYLYLCGIIPGPHAPHGHPLNHNLMLLIDDLTATWQKGVLPMDSHAFQGTYCSCHCCLSVMWHERSHALLSIQVINTLVVSVS